MVAKAKKTKGTVLVTGASRGLGFEFARQYLADGWNVIATSQKPEKAAQLKKLIKENDNISLFQLDVTDEKSVARLAKGLKGAAIDVLINNSGVLLEGRRKASKEFAVAVAANDEFVATFRVNVLGSLRLTEALAVNVKKARGKIINISSSAGSIALANNFSAQFPAYGASKAALNFIMRIAAQLLAKHKILVVNFCPGWVRTEMGGKEAPLSPTESIAALRKTIAKISIKQTGQFLDRTGKKIPW